MRVEFNAAYIKAEMFNKALQYCQLGALEKDEHIYLCELHGRCSFQNKKNRQKKLTFTLKHLEYLEWNRILFLNETKINRMGSDFKK